MYLLEGHRPPDHNTLARFRSQVLAGEVGEERLWQVSELLIQAGFVDMSAVLIDGTKLEANANKYTFVWKKATVKQLEKLKAKILEQLPGLLAGVGVKRCIAQEMDSRYLKKLHKRLYAQKAEAGIEFVHGTGKRKTALQRADQAGFGFPPIPVPRKAKGLSRMVPPGHCCANILKSHYKLKNGCLGTGLVVPKGFPVGL